MAFVIPVIRINGNTFMKESIHCTFYMNEKSIE